MSIPRRPPPASRPATWVAGADGGPYDVDNLPYGVFSAPGLPVQVGVRVGDQVLAAGEAAGRLRPEWAGLLAAPSLNPLLAGGPGTWAAVRAWLQAVLTDRRHAGELRLADLSAARLRLPFEVADFVDFYASIDHASNVGKILRPGADPLSANWRHLPIGYHGRAGSVVVSGTDVYRPCGQRREPDAAGPVFGPTQRLDIEAELGFVVGRDAPHGGIGTGEFADSVFGVVGVNDWSARDIQAWEYVPLGPNLGKSFATSVAAWVTPLAALGSARVPLPAQEPPVLGYLRGDDLWGLDIGVEVEVNGTVVARPQYRGTYWSPAQMLAHMTVNGAALRVGDLFASGTISGPGRAERGSFLELSWGGREPWSAGGQRRTFLEDGDEVVLRYSAPGERGRLGLGEVRGAVKPARNPI
jgi:fumarylacetoacetase